MAFQYAVYNDENMEAGKFYIVEVDKDNASNLRAVTSITQPIATNTQDISEIKTDMEAITDNTARINNLEDRNLQQELLYALDQASIKATFVNQTEVVIQHNRKEIYIKKVMVYVGTIEGEETFEDITSTVKISEIVVKDNGNNVIMKKVIIKTNNPITGYTIIV